MIFKNTAFSEQERDWAKKMMWIYACSSNSKPCRQIESTRAFIQHILFFKESMILSGFQGQIVHY